MTVKHYRVTGQQLLTLCGQTITDKTNITPTMDGVTCGKCQRMIGKREKNRIAEKKKRYALTDEEIDKRLDSFLDDFYGGFDNA